MGFNNDTKFNGGQYSIAGHDLPFGHYWDIADHTFVICNVDSSGDPLQFHCYGGVSGSHQTYPAITGRGDHRLAKAICCFNPDESRTDFDHKTGGRLLLGDCCGIIYGVTGVCHQMANRILASSNSGIMISAAGYWASVSAYGVYGSGGLVSGPTAGMAWVAYYAACLAMTGITESNKEPLLGASEDESSQKLMVNAMNLEKEHAENKELPGLRLKLVATHRLGADFASDKMDKLVQFQMGFDGIKKNIDESYIAKDISSTRHASLVNIEYNKFLTKCAQVITTEEYKQLFGLTPGNTYELIDTEIAKDTTHPTSEGK